MISNDIDIDRWRRQLALRSRVQIPDFLQADAADALADELSTRTPWQLAERSGGESRTTPRGAYPDDAAFDTLLQRGYALARTQYQFSYDSYMLIRAAKEGWDPDLLAHHVLRRCSSNSPATSAATRPSPTPARSARATGLGST